EVRRHHPDRDEGQRRAVDLRRDRSGGDGAGRGRIAIGEGYCFASALREPSSNTSSSRSSLPSALQRRSRVTRPLSSWNHSAINTPDSLKRWWVPIAIWLNRSLATKRPNAARCPLS